MILTPVYEIENYEKFKNEMEKFDSLINTLSRHDIIKFTPAFTVKGKYLIITTVKGDPLSDALAYIIYWLYKKKIIKLYGFLTEKGLFTRNNRLKNLIDFNVYAELLDKIQKSNSGDKLIVRNAKTGRTFTETESKVVVLGFEQKAEINLGVRKIIGVKVYYSLTPDYDLNECYKNQLFPEGVDGLTGDIIMTIKGSKITFTYPEIPNNDIVFCDLSKIEFSVRDIILLLTPQKYLPYSNHVLNYELNPVYISGIIQAQKLKPIIKGLLLDWPSRIELDEKTMQIVYAKYGKVKIDLQKIRKIVMGVTSIGLSKFLKLNSIEYKNLGRIKIPVKFKELFQPINEIIDFGAYVKYDKLLIPLIMVDSFHYFVATPLLAGITLYGVLKGLIPYKTEFTDYLRTHITVNYDEKVKITLKPSKREVNLIICAVETYKNSIPSIDNPQRSFVEIYVNDKVMAMFSHLLKRAESLRTRITQC